MAGDTAILGTEGESATPSLEADAAERPSDDDAEKQRAHQRRWWPVVVCAAAYGGLALLNFGPLRLVGPGHMVGHRTADLICEVWWIQWAYSALIHGQNPFFSNWQNYPVGINAGVNGSMLILGVLVSPITSLFGPIVSWNVLERAAPFVSAFSMCLVLRRWTRWWPAAFVGGLLYGFSSYVVSQPGHLFLAFVPLPPIFFFLLYEALVRQRWGPKRTGALLALVCAAQFFVFSELFASMVLMGVCATVLYLLANRRHLSVDTDYLKTALLTGVLVGAAVLVYPIFVTLFGPQHINGVPSSPANSRCVARRPAGSRRARLLPAPGSSRATFVLLAERADDVSGCSPRPRSRHHRRSDASAWDRPARGGYDADLTDSLVGLDALHRRTRHSCPAPLRRPDSSPPHPGIRVKSLLPLHDSFWISDRRHRSRCAPSTHSYLPPSGSFHNAPESDGRYWSLDDHCNHHRSPHIAIASTAGVCH